MVNYSDLWPMVVAAKASHILRMKVAVLRPALSGDSVNSGVVAKVWQKPALRG